MKRHFIMTVLMINIFPSCENINSISLKRKSHLAFCSDFAVNQTLSQNLKRHWTKHSSAFLLDFALLWLKILHNYMQKITSFWVNGHHYPQNTKDSLQIIVS